MSRVDIMVDLETLGNTKDSSIIQLAAAKFDIATGKILEEFNFYIDIENTVNLKATGSTIRWWLKNNPELLAKIVNQGTVTEKVALELFHEFISKEEDPYLWGNGIMFDNLIILNLMETHGLKYPIYYRNDRDVRTIVELAAHKLGIGHYEFIDQYTEDFGDKHDAMNDVKAQISYVSKAYQILTESQEDKSIVVMVDGGLVQNVMTNFKDADITILDYDSEGADLDKCIPKEEAHEIIRALENITYTYTIVD